MAASSFYGFHPRGSLFASLPAARRTFTVGAGALAAGDLVNLEAGLLVVASTGDYPVGVSEKAQSISATGAGVNVTPFLTVIAGVDNDSTTFASTHVGYGFDITGTTGIQQVDTSSADNTATAPLGTLRCLEYAPNVSPYNADTTVGLFVIAAHQLIGDAS